jgi:CheY-like chemotaxis protein
VSRLNEPPLVLLVEDDRAGCEAVLPKPCEPEDVTSTLKTLIDDARERRSA